MTDASGLDVSSFHAATAALSYADLAGQDGVQVESAAAFEEMRRYVLEQHHGAAPVHSFELAGGEVIDCLASEQHPALAASGGAMAEPPPIEAFPGHVAASPGLDAATTPELAPQFHPRLYDRAGRQMWCPAGTVPLLRLDVPRLARFRTLRDFLAKGPPGTVAAAASTDVASDARRYAVGFETVPHIGASSLVNVWAPFISASQQGYVQQWHGGRTPTLIQSIECGWHIDFARYRDSHPHLFIYWTPDTYATGGFNTDDQAFVPRAGASWRPGVTLQASQAGGTQVEYRMGYFLSDGAWWFYFNGEWLGYYPASRFGNGPLARAATSIEFGGETATNFSQWPPMGSGARPNDGFGRCAYQRDCVVTPAGGAARQARLTDSLSATSCYGLAISNSAAAPWGTHLFFGGPGGSGC